MSEVLERCVYRHMFILFRPSVHHLQDGFVTGRSTVISLLKTTHCFAEALDSRQHIAAIFLDFSKAFDSVPASCLVKKLHSIGIRGSLLRWLHSYVMGRQHRTVVDGETSSWLPCSLIREATRVYPGAAIIRYLH